MNLREPRVVDDSVSRAFEAALAEGEPAFVAQEAYVDDRGWSLMNQLQGVLRPEGQINFSVQYPGVIKAWHRHTRQTDFWICLTGHMKVGVYRDEDGAAWMSVLGEMRPGVLVIPPYLWHGAATVGHRPAGLLYYVTHAYDPTEPDEERRPHDSVAGFSWQMEHR